MPQAHDPVDANRRGSRRAGLRRPCVLHLPRGESRSGMTIDVGMDGLCVLTARPIAAGTRCRVSFELPLGDNGFAIDAAVKTVYSSYGAEGFKIGAVYSEFDAAAAEALRAFLAPQS